MRLLRVALFASLATATALQDARAAPREIATMRDIVAHLAPGTLLVLDIDNTLVEPAQSLGSDQWFYYIARRFRLVGGLSEARAQARAERIWNESQWLIQVRPVEPDTPGMIRAQQQRGVRTLGLTARSPAIADRTFDQLASVGIQLDAATIASPTHRDGRTVFYTRGVLFVGEGADKGERLVALLARSGYRPRGVVFVDDKLHHAHAVERALVKRGIATVAFRYGAADPRVRAFLADVAHLELLWRGVIDKTAAAAIDQAKRRPRPAATRP